MSIIDKFDRWRATKARERAILQRMRRDGSWSAGLNGVSGNGFAGAAINRLTASMAGWSGAVNADLDGSLVIMRARARSLAANNEFARRFLSMLSINVIGANGPTLQVRARFASRNPDQPGALDKAANDAVEIHWQKFCKTADITGRMNLAHLLRVCIKGVARDGEALLRKVRDRKLPYGFALQALEADRLVEAMNQKLSNGNVIRQGIEMDTAGRPVAYWLRSAHPGEHYQTAAMQYERVPAEQIVHIYLPERAEQVRGYTWFHAVIMRIAMLGGYQESAVVAARVGASKMAALVRKEDAPDALETLADGKEANGGNLLMDVEPGGLFELPPGYDLASWNPEYPHANFDSFIKTCLRGIAAGLDVATHNLSGDMTDVNYSSARIAELCERDMWRVMQAWWIHAVMQPIYNEWLSMSLLRGDITFEATGKALPAERLQKFADASRFQGRGWSWVDPLKETRAASEEIAAGLNSRTRLAAEQGEDFDDILEELTQEQKQLAAANLLPPKNPSSVVDPANDLPEDAAPAGKLLRLFGEFLMREQPAPVFNFTTGPTEIRAGETHVNLPEGMVQVDAQINMPEQAEQFKNGDTIIHVAPSPAPNVTVVNEVQPAPVGEIKVISLPTRKTSTDIQRDSAGNITHSTQYELDA